MISYVNNSLLSTETGYWDADRKIIKAGPFLYNGFLRVSSAGTVDIGGRLTVCAGIDAIWTHSDIGRYNDSFHVWLAAKATTIPPELSLMQTQVNGPLGYSNGLLRRNIS